MEAQRRIARPAEGPGLHRRRYEGRAEGTQDRIRDKRIRAAARTVSVSLLGALTAGLLLYAVYLRALSLLPPAAEPLALHAAESRAFAAPQNEAGEKLNLNTAALWELAALPGIGEKTAAAIIALREEIGYFRYPEDLLMVKGIGAAKLDAIYDLIDTQPPAERNDTHGNTAIPPATRRPAAQDAGL